MPLLLKRWNRRYVNKLLCDLNTFHLPFPFYNIPTNHVCFDCYPSDTIWFLILIYPWNLTGRLSMLWFIIQFKECSRDIKTNYIGNITFYSCNITLKKLSTRLDHLIWPICSQIGSIDKLIGPVCDVITKANVINKKDIIIIFFGVERY